MLLVVAGYLAVGLLASRWVYRAFDAQRRRESEASVDAPDRQPESLAAVTLVLWPATAVFLGLMAVVAGIHSYWERPTRRERREREHRQHQVDAIRRKEAEIAAAQRSFDETNRQAREVGVGEVPARLRPDPDDDPELARLRREASS